MSGKVLFYNAEAPQKRICEFRNLSASENRTFVVVRG